MYLDSWKSAPAANVFIDFIDKPYYLGNVDAWFMNNPVYDFVLRNTETT